jgi:hypothetical protein
MFSDEQRTALRKVLPEWELRQIEGKVATIDAMVQAAGGLALAESSPDEWEALQAAEQNLYEAHATQAAMPWGR